MEGFKPEHWKLKTETEPFSFQNGAMVCYPSSDKLIHSRVKEKRETSIYINGSRWKTYRVLEQTHMIPVVLFVRTSIL